MHFCDGRLDIPGSVFVNMISNPDAVGTSAAGAPNGRRPACARSLPNASDSATHDVACSQAVGRTYDLPTKSRVLGQENLHALRGRSPALGSRSRT
jgi:hypothetical protein